MGNIRRKLGKWVGYIFMGSWLLAAIFNEIGVVNFSYINILATVSEPSPYVVRGQLLMEAMDQIGVCCPEDAAAVWSNGVMNRSAALQYAVMSAMLKDEYAQQLNQTASNWVTGLSSPWIDNYQIVKTEKISNSHYMIKILFSTATSAGPAEDATAILFVTLEEKFWRITDLTLDKTLYPYTGFIFNSL